MIPIFVSSPSDLNETQMESRSLILREMEEQKFEPISLGRNDYPIDLPLREVYVLAKHCAGGIILGFSQFATNNGIWKEGTQTQSKQSQPISFPTAWNQLEAGILFGLKLPLLVFRDKYISGGIFDPGVADVFVHTMPGIPLQKEEADGLRQLFLKWGGKVRECYYAY